MEKTLHRKEYQIILRLLIQARKAAGVTQVNLAASLDIPRSTVSKWETGEQRIDLLELWSVCDAIGVDPIQLLMAFRKKWKRN